MNINQNESFSIEKNLSQSILRLSIPIIMSNFINTLYNLIDTYWLGKLGSNELAAITLVTPLQQMTISFAAGVTVAGSILLTQYIGAKRHDDVKRMLTQLSVYALVFSFILSILGFILATPIVRWLGTNGEVFQMGRTYFSIVILDMPFLIMVQLYAGLRQAQGDTRSPLYLNLVGVIINLILDPLFIIVFGWGVAGAGYATLGAKIPGALIAFYLLSNKSKPFYIEWKKFKYDPQILKKIIQIGLPVASGGALMQFGFVLMTRQVWDFGTISVAAFGIGNRINNLITMPSNALGSAAATVVGQNVGADNWERAEKGYKLTLKMAVGFLIIGGLILSRESVAVVIVKIFSEDPEVIRLGTQYLQILALYSFVNGVYNTTIGLFSATGHTVLTMVIEVSRLWIFRFGTLYFLQVYLNWQVESIWYSVVLSNALAAGCLYLLYLMGVWKSNKVSEVEKVF